MPKYFCYRCGYNTNIVTHMENHLRRKNNCKPKLRDICVTDYRLNILNCDNFEDIENEKGCTKNAPFCTKLHQIDTILHQNMVKEGNPKSSHICTYCNKSYDYKRSLNRHLKTCKEKKEHDNEMNKMYILIDKLNEQLKVQEEKIEDQQEKINDQQKKIDQLKIKKTTNNNLQINGDVNINLNRLDYNKTDYDCISDEDIKNAIHMTNKCVQAMFKSIHFNTKYPQNQNIYVSNLKSGMAMVLEKNRWDAKQWDKIASKIIHDTAFTMYSWLQDNKEGNPELNRRFKKFENNSNELVKEQKDDLYLSMYNNRGMVFSDETIKRLQNMD